ncbi:MAG: DNA translocase FtsK 4TM domain-containing protein [Paracoccus sp. (in: a-proteobacteria)]
MPPGKPEAFPRSGLSGAGNRQRFALNPSPAPSLNTATTRSASNWIGAPGALWADLLLQSFGVAAYLVPLMLIFAVGGTYVYRSNPMDLYFMIGFGLFGYVARKLRFDVTPLVMGFILTPPLEYALAQSMMLSRGDLPGYLIGTRPIALAILLLTPVLIIWLGYRQSKQRRALR